MRVLYIGGTGEISYACVMASLQLGHEVTVLNRGLRLPLSPEVRQVHGDLQDAAAYQALIREEFDTVCQFLAFTTEAIERDIHVFKGRCNQYIFISTASAYRKPTAGELITEQTPLENPFWDYSRKKIACELRLQAETDFPVTVVRPSHTYRERVPSTVVTGDHLVWRMLRKKPVIAHDGGQTLWTLTHATDFAAAFTALIGEPRALGEALHITSSEAYTWNDILTCVAEALGCVIDIRPVPTEKLVEQVPEWAGPLLGDKARSVQFDNSKVQRLLPSWSCRIGLTTGIEASIKSLLDRPQGVPEPHRQLDALIDRIVASA